MELLYERKNITGFCIVSSDSDFTGLAQFIMGKGKPVLGIGEKKTPESFRNACSQFLYIEDLPQTEMFITNPNEIFNQDEDAVSEPMQSFEQSFIQAYEISTTDSEGWVPLTEIKEQMITLDEEFKNTRQFAERVKSLSEFYPAGIIEVEALSDHKPIIHVVRIADCDIFKFIEAYERAPVRERDEWVMLSVIGTELRKYPSYENGFTYRGIKSRKLSKVVSEMLKDYHELIELIEDQDGNSITHLVRVNISNWTPHTT